MPSGMALLATNRWTVLFSRVVRRRSWVTRAWARWGETVKSSTSGTGKCWDGHHDPVPEHAVGLHLLHGDVQAHLGQPDGGGRHRRRERPGDQHDAR